MCYILTPLKNIKFEWYYGVSICVCVLQCDKKILFMSIKDTIMRCIVWGGERERERERVLESGQWNKNYYSIVTTGCGLIYHCDWNRK